MGRTLAALALGLATLLSGPGFAQEAAGSAAEESPAKAAGPVEQLITQELSPETLALGLKLVELAGSARVFDQVLPNIADQTKNAFIRANPQMQLGIIDIVDRVALTLVPRRPELNQYLARVWASAFTNEEMQDLIDFFSTDTGKKFGSMQARLLTVETAAAQQWAAEIAAELRSKVQAELRAALEADEDAIEGDAPEAAPAPEGQAGEAPAQ